MNIKKELNSIILLKKKGLKNELITNLSFEDREYVLNLNKNLDRLNKDTIIKIRNNPHLVDCLNNSTISLENFNIVITCKEIKELENLLENFDNDLFNQVKDKCHKANNIPNNYLITFSYINIKENKMDLSEVEYIKSRFSSLFSNIPLFINFCINLKENIRDFCYESDVNIYKLYDCLCKNKKFNHKLLDFCDELFFKAQKHITLNDELLKIVETINSMKNNEEIAEFKEILLKFAENEVSCEWIKKLASMDKLLKLEELKRLSNVEITKETSKNPTDILYNSPILSKLSDMYLDFKSDLIAFKIEFIKGNIKKKGFIKLVNENMADFIQLKSNCILFNEKFSKIINLNTLNHKNLQSLYEMDWTGIFDILNKNVPLTFNEFEVLYNKCIYTSGHLISKIYYNLLDLKIDQRIKLIKQLPKLKISELGLNGKLDLLEGDITLSIANLLKVKSFRDRINSLNMNIERVTDVQLLLLFLYEDKVKDYIKTIKYGSDIEFLLLNYKDINKFDSVVKAKEEYYKTQTEFNFLINKLNINEDFAERNKDRIMNFCDKGLHKVFMTLHQNIYDQQQENLKLLVKAEILGKLKDIKFSDKDFDLEIGLQISKEAKNEWKKNISNQGKFLYEETYDFERIIKLGEYPVSTCQHWHRGMYVECLLSNFDTNKKMLTSSKNGVLNARSLFRLTKGTLDKDNVSLTFLDVEKLENENVAKNYNKQELVLFLEKMYTNLDIKEELMVRKEFLKIAKEKANKLDARLVVSEDYKDIMNEFDDFELKDYYLFISYSKNGYQYLDSLNGSCSSKNEGNFEECYAYIQK